jgi:hypothetical protein
VLFETGASDLTQRDSIYQQQAHDPLSNEYGTHQMVKAIFWAGLSD